MTSPARWRVLQVADSAFPTGGFAHSAGLEAAVHAGEARTSERLESWLHAHLWNVGTSSLPFVAATHDRPFDVWAIDALADAQMTNHVANRASRTQGRAFAATCARVFDEQAVAELARAAASRSVASHLAPVFGAVLALLGVDRREALALHLLLALRAITSAAIRLGLVGPHEAQRMQRRHTSALEEVVAACASLDPGEAANAAPLVDLFGATHDRLDSRLFQS
ncbi:MAG TPA: urease accessory UreF family protein [Polyangiaceae bacterium]|nr:urease accessory UreF family protein [Polyangiaceae bacterium]